MHGKRNSMARIYTEIRISHKTLEEKQEYEEALDKALKKHGYKTRTEFIQEKIRELIKSG
jgi:hypothetical protein